MSELKLRCVMWSVWFGLVVMCVPLRRIGGKRRGMRVGRSTVGMRGGARYSTAAQINRENLTRLKVAWTYRTEALAVQTDLNHKAAFEATPILVDGMLYLSTPYDHVIALDPKSGTKAWEFFPKLDLMHGYSEVTSRGVSRGATRRPRQTPFVHCGFLRGRSTRG
jgi:quinoprotein glucose dehydrogenase